MSSHARDIVHDITDVQTVMRNFEFIKIGWFMAEIRPFLWNHVTSLWSYYNLSSVCVGESQGRNPIDKMTVDSKNNLKWPDLSQKWSDFHSVIKENIPVGGSIKGFRYQ